MNFQVTFKHMESSEALEDYARGKLQEKVLKHVPRPVSLDVTFGVENLDHRVHVNLNTGEHLRVQVDATDINMYAAVDQVAEKLERKLRKSKEKRQSKRHHSVKELTPVADEEPSIDASEIIAQSITGV